MADAVRSYGIAESGRVPRRSLRYRKAPDKVGFVSVVKVLGLSKGSHVERVVQTPKRP